jgi:hypothetical protein
VAESRHEDNFDHGGRVDELIELRLGQVPGDLRVRLDEEPAPKASIGQGSGGRRKILTKHILRRTGRLLRCPNVVISISRVAASRSTRPSSMPGTVSIAIGHADARSW